MSRPLITEPGFYPALTCEQYFAEPCPAPALTNSGIGALLNACPAKFAYNHPAIGQPPEEQQTTAARRLGNLVHRLALGKGAEYIVSPHETYRSAEAKAWKAEQELGGLLPVKQAEFEQAEVMAERIAVAIEAETRGHQYQTEVVIAWKRPVAGGPPIWCRAMLDVWCPELNLALDVKKTRSASDGAISRSMANYGYAGQAAWYADGIEALSAGRDRPRFGFLFVEDDPPHLARFAECSEAFRHGASIANDRAAEIFARCLRDDDWPGYSPLTVQPPTWWLAQVEDMNLMEAA